jgi:chemotaxis protein MotA
MLLIGGVIAVIVAVVGGYLWEGGHLMLLWQPAEFLIIAGCAAGILLISTPMAVLGALSEQTKRLFTPPPMRKDYEDLLSMMYQLFRVAQSTARWRSSRTSTTEGEHRPREVSEVSGAPRRAVIPRRFDPDHHRRRHCDARLRSSDVRGSRDSPARVPSAGQHAHESRRRAPGPRHRRRRARRRHHDAGDRRPAAEIGHKVGAALVGTFLGILLSYGFVQPVAASLEHRVSRS